MRKWNLGSGRDKIMAEINVTPLVDVSLVLLVIFMVTTPLIFNESFKIKLPTAVSSDAQPEVKLSISLTKENEVYLNDKAVTLENLAAAIAPKLAASSDKTVVIHADKHVYHGTVVQVLDICKKAGAQRLALATEPDKQKK
ncbi:MAG: biopolymer transporter ExbD [Nitrospirota bacterium]|nr:biopolymer transporter ExbD [Nitrospirota bacterium]